MLQESKTEKIVGQGRIRRIQASLSQRKPRFESAAACSGPARRAGERPRLSEHARHALPLNVLESLHAPIPPHHSERTPARPRRLGAAARPCRTGTIACILITASAATATAAAAAGLLRRVQGPAAAGRTRTGEATHGCGVGREVELGTRGTGAGAAGAAAVEFAGGTGDRNAGVE